MQIFHTVNDSKSLFHGKFAIRCDRNKTVKVPLDKAGTIFAVVSEMDAIKVLKQDWRARLSGTPDRPYLYAITRITDPKTNKKRTVQLGAYITGSYKMEGVLTDHIDGNTTNNTRSNLRFATPSQNSANSQLRIDSTTGFKGVSISKHKSKPYQAQVCVRGEYYHLGYYAKIEDAAMAYDRGAKLGFGAYAKTNKMQGLLK